MSALEWIREKAKEEPKLSETFEFEGREVKSICKEFKGKLPYRMRRELVKQSKDQISTDFEQEVIRFDTTPSGHETGIVYYSHVKYEYVN